MCVVSALRVLWAAVAASACALRRARRRSLAGRHRWIACRKSSFFLPVRVLSRRFREKFLGQLRQAFRNGALRSAGNSVLWRSRLFRACARGRRNEWVVYVKPPFGGPQRVLKYLARYTHRVAISNHRLRSLEHGRVTFAGRTTPTAPHQDHDSGRGRVHPPFSAARAAARVGPHPPLRLSCQSRPSNKLEQCRTLLAAPPMPLPPL